MSEKLADGSQETIEHRGRIITLWRTFDFVGRRPIRRWYYRIDQNGPFQAFKTREAAFWDAKVRIGGQTWRLDLRDLFGGEFDFSDLDDLDVDLDDPVDLIDTTSEPRPEDRQVRIRKKLEMMTVANGCTADEETTAKKILASM